MPDRHDEGRRLGLTPDQVASRCAEFERRNRAARRAEADNPGPLATIGGVRANTEWSAGAERVPEAHQERPLFAFPGIWKRYRGPMKKDGPEVEVDVYAFMTTTPNSLTATIMHDRMPVLLSDERDFETWLSAPPEEAFRLVRTFDAERMRIVQRGERKEDLLGRILVG